MGRLFLIVIFVFYCSFSYGSYRIHNLSLIDSVFANFRDSILKLKSKEEFSGLAFRFRFKLAIYKLKSGDDLKNIASRLGIATDTLISLNSLSSSYELFVGKEIYIPNLRGTFVYLEEGMDRDSLASMYDIPLWLLLKVNNITREKLYKGERIFIPFRPLSLEEKRYFDSSVFYKPVVAGYLSSLYGIRLDPFNHKKTFHGGLDMAVPYGSPVYAAQSGKVIFAGYKGAYGNLIVVEHKYNYKTFYGHLSRIKVRKGDIVYRARLIGNVGSSGRSTGPHLHFEIRRFDNRLDPMKFIHR